MNINETNGTSIFEQLNLAQQTANDSNSSELGQTDFLQLMTTQLQNQDPFSPLENGEFIGQLAQFGTVSGIETLQQSFESFAGALQSNRALEASVMVGRSVLVPGATAALAQGGTLSGGVSLPAASDNVVVKVHNTSGELVATRNLNGQAAGIVRFTWDGLNDGGDPVVAGNYQVQAEAQIGNEVEQLGTFVSGNVDSVTLGGSAGEFTLHVAGIGDVRIDDVVQIN